MLKTNELQQSQNTIFAIKIAKTLILSLQLIASFLLIPGTLFAQNQSGPIVDGNKNNTTATNQSDPPAAESDKLDVDNLEKKYWSAKDDDFTVVQNRTYTKDKKFYVSLLTGKIINDGFIEGVPTSLSFGYFFNEKNGINIDSTNYNTKNSSITTQFIAQNGASPVYNTILKTTTFRYFWSPIYAKVSLLEKKILYLDVAFGIHFGQTEYKKNTNSGGLIDKTSHYGFDVSQLWFLNRYIALRFDIRNTWSTQDVRSYYSSGAVHPSIGNKRFQDNAWLLGVNFFFGGKQ